MLRSRQATKAVRALAQSSRQPHRPFTVSPVTSTIKSSTQLPSAIRNQTTAAQSTPAYSQARDIPAPAFNSANAKDRSHVQPLVNPGTPEMDES
ncbi:hypothetical protein O1611_g8814 [Lasiodiplodia mahajangana]|uniref:Uncharacterized protein n=1 Tax=Lasiodiplodia mahajangana TaxID=1108764 RepID=A0ACC2JC16_9PEZI|nr:hypothetical protein O1611_g8814 [Lasiodiplodia mahajangana]